ncbi:dehydrogenase [Sphingomonas metalli]|uniref:Dehydrogenase n=1 Tax=Sphingomonas metalli TaxID=1779358 RepID=A0A916WMU2_9SPHN|nr:SDR family oxidoreductase [Sphingomonas metalli]GGB15736.1 dehydrogenase [Sphingomonas metalli]
MVRPLALVTGGARRLGAAIAARLAQEGYDLAIHCSREKALEPPLADLGCATFVADFAEAGAAERLFGSVVACCGRPPALLVNNASVFGPDRAGEATAATLAEAFAVNCAAPVLLTQAMAAAGGRTVINILDQRIAHPHRDQLSYTLGKLGLAGWSTIAAASFPTLRVNAVAPGLTLPTGDYDAAQMARLSALMPLGRLPTPNDIADAVAYLAAAPVTGQTLFVDGGAHLVPFDEDFVSLAR